MKRITRYSGLVLVAAATFSTVINGFSALEGGKKKSALKTAIDGYNTGNVALGVNMNQLSDIITKALELKPPTANGFTAKQWKQTVADIAATTGVILDNALTMANLGVAGTADTATLLGRFQTIINEVTAQHQRNQNGQSLDNHSVAQVARAMSDDTFRQNLLTGGMLDLISGYIEQYLFIQPVVQDPTALANSLQALNAAMDFPGAGVAPTLRDNSTNGKRAFITLYQGFLNAGGLSTYLQGFAQAIAGEIDATLTDTEVHLGNCDAELTEKAAELVTIRQALSNLRPDLKTGLNTQDPAHPRTPGVYAQDVKQLVNAVNETYRAAQAAAPLTLLRDGAVGPQTVLAHAINPFINCTQKVKLALTSLDRDLQAGLHLDLDHYGDDAAALLDSANTLVNALKAIGPLPGAAGGGKTLLTNAVPPYLGFFADCRATMTQHNLGITAKSTPSQVWTSLRPIIEGHTDGAVVSQDRHQAALDDAARARQDHTALLDLHTKLQQGHRALQLDHDRLQADLTAAKATGANQATTIATLEKDLAKQAQDLAAATRDAEDSMALAEQLQIRLTDTVEHHQANLDAATTELRSENAKLKTELERARQEIARLKKVAAGGPSQHDASSGGSSPHDANSQ